MRDEREIARNATAATLLDERERLIVVGAVEPRHQDRHRSLAAETDAPDQIVRAARVVVGDDRRSCQHRACALHQVRFQATAAQQPRRAAIAGEQHLCARFAVRGAERAGDGCEYERLAAVAAVAKEIAERNATVIHGLRYPSNLTARELDHERSRQVADFDGYPDRHAEVYLGPAGGGGGVEGHHERAERHLGPEQRAGVRDKCRL